MLFNTLRQLLNGGHVDISSLIAQILSILFVVLFILPMHEVAHAWMANKLGDPTAKLDGRLTLNPLASVEPMGALWLLLFGFGWAKPVPVNSRNFRNPKRDTAIVAAAGPLSNVLAALIGALVYVPLLYLGNLHNGVVYFFLVFINYYILVNISIAVFNLIPIPPLDGSRIIGAFLSDRALQGYYRYQRIIFGIFFILMISGVLSRPISSLQSILTQGVVALAELPYKLFGVI